MTWASMPCAASQRQPEAIVSSLERNGDTADPMALLFGLPTPATQQLEQCVLVDRDFLQRLAFNARNNATHKPARLAHLQDTDTMLDIRSLRRRSIIASTPMREWLCPLPRARFIATSSS